MVSCFHMSLLESIGSPDDVKKLSLSELRNLAEEMRAKIIETVRTNGGHLASNLGVIELTIALHRVFDSPRDAIVWDVGHQSYAHKLLTGRVDRFPGIRRKGGLSGFPKRSESIHDIFDTGHSSTSISSALGLLEARKLARRDGRVVAVIGDGALTGGMSMEGLGNVAQLGLPLIVILNDNKMSISRNVGAISRYLSRLSASVRYQSLRRKIDALVESIPGVGHLLFAVITRAKRAVKAVFFKENLFSDLGFEYVGPIDGHNIPLLLSVFGQVRQLERPVVVHVVTTKGKGYDKAEEDPERFHGVSPSCPDARQDTPFFTEVFGETMMEIAEDRRDLVAVAAAMTRGNGLEPLERRFPAQVFDVGIAEQHAVTFAAGLATGGRLPVVAIYSTFMQRAVDQVIHDVALPNLHVVFALDRSGAVGEDGETHQGFYDIALFKGLPHMTLMAPADAADLKAFLFWAMDRKGPVMLRYPKSRVDCARGDAAAVVEGRGVLMRKDSHSSILVCALGPLAYAALRAAETLAEEGIRADVYSLRFAAPIDEAYLCTLCRRYSHVLTVEDGSVAGGVGESIAAMLARSAEGPRVTILGFSSIPPAQATRDELLRDAGLDEAGIAAAARNLAAASVGAEMRNALSVASGL